MAWKLSCLVSDLCAQSLPHTAELHQSASDPWDAAGMSTALIVSFVPQSPRSVSHGMRPALRSHTTSTPHDVNATRRQCHTTSNTTSTPHDVNTTRHQRHTMSTSMPHDVNARCVTKLTRTETHDAFRPNPIVLCETRQTSWP